MANIYSKYCTSMQNHGLGSFSIVAFINGYHSIHEEYPNWFDIFLVLPMIMNEQVRELIKKSVGRGGTTTIETLISSKILNKREKYGAFHKFIMNVQLQQFGIYSKNLKEHKFISFDLS